VVWLPFPGKWVVYNIVLPTLWLWNNSPEGNIPSLPCRRRGLLPPLRVASPSVAGAGDPAGRSSPAIVGTPIAGWFLDNHIKMENKWFIMENHIKMDNT